MRMKAMTAAEAQNKFGQLLEAAQRRPVAVTRHGRRAAIVMSVADYERQQRQAWSALMDSLKHSQAHARTQGLTEAKLQKLLADES
jgi:antitoxin Phd